MLSVNSQMLFPHIARCKQSYKLRRRSSLLHIRPSVRLFALHQTHHTGYFETEFSRGFDGLNSGCSRRANIIDDYDSRSLAPETLDPLTRSVLLLGLAHQKTIQ